LAASRIFKRIRRPSVGAGIFYRFFHLYRRKVLLTGKRNKKKDERKKKKKFLGI
jgi:hypothetical protein